MYTFPLCDCKNLMISWASLHFSTSLITILKQLQLSAEKIIWTIHFSFSDQKKYKRRKEKLWKNSWIDSLVLAIKSSFNKVKKTNKQTTKHLIWSLEKHDLLIICGTLEAYPENLAKAFLNLWTLELSVYPFYLGGINAHLWLISCLQKFLRID